MIKSLLVAGSVASALFAPAFAGGLTGNYVGIGFTADTSVTNTASDSEGSLSARIALPNTFLSVRPQLTIGNVTGGSLAVTGDLPVVDNVNLYGGGGIGLGAGTLLNNTDEAVGFAVVGVEGAITSNVVLFADVRFGFGGETTYVPTAGVAFRF